MYKKVVSILLLWAVALSVMAMVCAEDGPAKSNNIGKNNYVDVGSTVESYLVAQPDGTFLRVEAIDGQVVIETYSSALEFKSARVLQYELPLFGGFYEGTDDFFLAFGQENPEEDDSAEVIRVVRYDKNWNRIGGGIFVRRKYENPFCGRKLADDALRRFSVYSHLP